MMAQFKYKQGNRVDREVTNAPFPKQPADL